MLFDNPLLHNQSIIAYSSYPHMFMTNTYKHYKNRLKPIKQIQSSSTRNSSKKDCLTSMYLYTLPDSSTPTWCEKPTTNGCHRLCSARRTCSPPFRPRKRPAPTSRRWHPTCGPSGRSGKHAADGRYLSHNVIMWYIYINTCLCTWKEQLYSSICSYLYLCVTDHM